MTLSTNIYFPTSETEKCFIKSIWRLQEFNFKKQTETILPKGVVEIIFNLSDNITYINSSSDNGITLPPCFINGLNFKPFKLIKNGQQLFLGIQLNVISLKCLFGIPAQEFNDTVVESSQVCESLNELYDQLFLEKTFEKQVEIIRNWLSHKISESKHTRTVHKMHSWFYTQEGEAKSVNELCHKVGISDRQLRRLSTEWLGVNTEAYLLYKKYLTALQLLHNSDLSLTQIGLMAGYYDQSHFIREFKTFTNLTPTEYKSSVKGISGHIFG